MFATCVPGSVFVDLHVYVNPGMSTSQGHSIASEVEHRVCSKWTNIVDAIVHIEPALVAPSSDWEQISYGLRQIAEGMGLNYHDLHVHVFPEGEFSIELDLEIQGNHTLKGAHNLADDFENRVMEFWPKARQIITHMEPAAEKLLYPVVGIDEGTSNKIKSFLNSIVPDECVKSIQFQVIEEQLSVVITLGMASEISLVETHIRVEEIKIALLNRFSEIFRLVIHVEPINGHKGSGSE
jgi:divalent metal cation (Fe/Co/Zn/Cd) transporter